MTKKETRGGKRPGAGRKKLHPTAILPIRIDKELLIKARAKFGREIHGLVTGYLKDQIEDAPPPKSL